MNLVVDASVVVKWFVDEIYAPEACQLLRAPDAFAAPDLLFAEVANVIWKKVRRGQLAAEDAPAMLSDLQRIDVETVPCRDIAAAACSLALATGRSVYDSMYLALAISRKTRLITADQRFANAVRSDALLAPHIQFIADTP
jgi:predicted nucleic acid-binding protein